MGWVTGRVSSDRATCSVVDMSEEASWGGRGKAQESSGSLPDGTSLAVTRTVCLLAGFELLPQLWT